MFEDKNSELITEEVIMGSNKGKNLEAAVVCAPVKTHL